MLRHHHRIVPGIVLTFVLAAAAPAAARFDLNPPPASTTTHAVTVSGGPSNTITTRGGHVLRHVAVPAGPRTVNTTLSRRSGAPSVVHVVTTNGGFHWGDAGIGAGSALAAALLLIGLVLGATHLRRRTARSSAQQTA